MNALTSFSASETENFYFYFILLILIVLPRYIYVYWACCQMLIRHRLQSTSAFNIDNNTKCLRSTKSAY